MSVTFDDAQKCEVDRIVERRLLRERRQHERDLRAQRASLEGEIAKLQLELRSERGLITRIREWLTR